MSRDPLDRPFESPRYPTDISESEDLKNRATEIASKARNTVTEMANSASETLNRQRQAAAGGLHQVAATIHEKAENLPGGPKAVNLAHGIADGMESTASYLREHDFEDMREDLMNICRRHPAQALLSALAVGFLVGRAIRRR
jgi:hypothetical protein